MATTLQVFLSHHIGKGYAQGILDLHVCRRNLLEIGPAQVYNNEEAGNTRFEKTHIFESLSR